MTDILDLPGWTPTSTRTEDGEYIILNIGGDGVLVECRADIDPEDWKWQIASGN